MYHPLLAQYDLHHRLFNNVLKGFTDEETNRRLYGDSRINHVKYIAGHLLNSQYGLAMLAGMKTEVKWNDLFAVMGASEARDAYPYPTIDEIRDEWNSMHENIRTGLARLGTNELKTSPPSPFNQVAETKGQLWAFISHHQAYHIGQIGILRKGFGKEPMSYE